MKQRVVTALLLAPIVLAAVFCSSAIPIMVLLCIVVLAGTYELSRLQKSKLVWLGLILQLLGAVALLISSKGIREPLAIYASLLFMTGVFCSRKPALDFKLHALFSPGWVLGPLLCAVLLHYQEPPTQAWNWTPFVLLGLLPIWAGDTAAIFAGKKWGRHKLAPSLSPNKTVEGAVANFAACLAMALLLTTAYGKPWWFGGVIGTLCGILGQAGDLFESSVKRQAGLKDSGNLLPGHGGVLDRIDSILFSIPAITIFILIVDRLSL